MFQRQNKVTLRELTLGMDWIKEQSEELQNELIELRRNFHAHPELGFEEHQTSKKVEEYLQSLGLQTERVAKTGVVAMIEGAEDGPVLMLRADMDALPIQEENTVDYVSKNPGVMHACGHDAHMSMLMGAAKILSNNKELIKGKIKLVFQPNEENAGALPMIEEGVLDKPKVDGAVGVHIWTPLPSGVVGISSGGVMSGLYIFEIKVKGYGGHSGYPETAIDPVIAASDIVLSAQRIQTREISSMKPMTMIFGQINGGTKANIIPDEVILNGSIRTLYDDSGDQPIYRLERLARDVSKTHGCECEVSWIRENIPLINDESMTEHMKKTAIEVVGADRVVPYSTMASEDFSEFTARIPGVFLFLGTGNEEIGTNFPHHNPRFNIDESVLHLGVELYVRGSIQYLGNCTKN
ncbi:M20 metallopeptidase family protein [Gudongella sp. DL1XJH-153]|uniref:M20 metallopeptidase family protein n=1 Tax=Gudongella sp. DL1XJH-153 TaxID=3409804 RepID=UPI003BB80858